TFAAYGFNKSHSAAYAVITYQTAYLKAHYRVEFMAGLLSLEAGDTDSTFKNIAECREHGIRVLAPDVNESRDDFTGVGQAIGFFITGHPLDRYLKDLRKFTNVTVGTLRTRGAELPPASERPGRESRPRVRIGGVINSIRLRNSKKGDRYATFTLEDKEGTV